MSKFINSRSVATATLALAVTPFFQGCASPGAFRGLSDEEVAAARAGRTQVVTTFEYSDRGNRGTISYGFQKTQGSFNQAVFYCVVRGSDCIGEPQRLSCADLKNGAYAYYESGRWQKYSERADAWRSNPGSPQPSMTYNGSLQNSVFSQMQLEIYKKAYALCYDK